LCEASILIDSDMCERDLFQLDFEML
jgi:hypothetical protein